MYGYREMCERFERSHLGLPPIPERFVPELRRLGEWAYATRDIDPVGMYMFGEYLDEVVTDRPADYVAVSHAGHGSNSYAITYQAVLGSVALYAQAGYGGVYGNPVGDAFRVRRMFNACAQLVDAADAAPACPQYRLIVCFSDFRGHSCEWRTVPGAAACPTVPAPGVLPPRWSAPEIDPMAVLGAAARALRAHHPCAGSGRDTESVVPGR